MPSAQLPDYQLSYLPQGGDLSRYGAGGEHRFFDYTRKEPEPDPESKAAPVVTLDTAIKRFTGDDQGGQERDTGDDDRYFDYTRPDPWTAGQGQFTAGSGGPGILGNLGQGFGRHLMGMVPGVDSAMAMKAGNPGRAVFEGLVDVAGIAFPPLGIALGLGSALFGDKLFGSDEAPSGQSYGDWYGGSDEAYVDSSSTPTYMDSGSGQGADPAPDQSYGDWYGGSDEAYSDYGDGGGDSSGYDGGYDGGTTDDFGQGW